MTVHGSTHPAFRPVRDEFLRSVRQGTELGASLAVWHEGELVVDLWAGLRDREAALPYEADTLTTMFSTTKGMVAICFLMLSERGLFDYDAKLSTYWPAFSSSDKRQITGRMLFNHRSGLIGLKEPLTIAQLERAQARVEDPQARDEVTSILERARPVWEPGTSQGYHAVTYGLYAAELFTRITGESIGTFFRREVAGPLSADVYIGLPEALEPRVAKNYAPTSRDRVRLGLPELVAHGLSGQTAPEGRILVDILRKGDSWFAFHEPQELGQSAVENFNTRRVHALELPWGNGLGSARGICRVYSALANGGSIDGVRVVRPETLAPLAERQSWSSRDRVLKRAMGWTQGFVKEDPGVFSNTSTTSFGHPGAGGALGWCDPRRKLAIGYVTVKMDHHVRSTRTLALCRMIEGCVGG